MEKRILHIDDMYGIQKNGTDELICLAGIEMQMERMDLWTQWGKERLGQIEKVASHIYTTICKIHS